MHQLDVDFDREEVRINRDSQQGTDKVPGLANMRREILEAVLLPHTPWHLLQFDFEAHTVRADGIVLRLTTEDLSAAVYKVLGYEPVDLSSVVSTIEDFVNGRIDDEEMRRRMDEEKM